MAELHGCRIRFWYEIGPMAWVVEADDGTWKVTRDDNAIVVGAERPREGA